MPTFDGQALGGSRANWAAKLRELLEAAQVALDAKDDNAVQEIQQTLEAYESYPCPDPDLRAQANRALDNLSVEIIAGLLDELEAPALATAPTLDTNAVPTMALKENTTPRQRLLHTFYSLSSLNAQHQQQAFSHEDYPQIGKQMNELASTLQSLLNKSAA